MVRSQYVILFANWLMLFLSGLYCPRPAIGQDEPYDKAPAFDFSDEFYFENGINSELILDRKSGQDIRSVVDASPDPMFADVRIVETTGGFSHHGDLLYYVVCGELQPDSFTNDRAGDVAREIANEYRAFLFPKADGNPLSPAPSNRRQDNIFDSSGGYFSNNPLGLWRLTFVSFTDDAFNTTSGRRMLRRLRKRNGADLDGTPIIKTLSEIESLTRNGFVEIKTRANDGSDGSPWVI